MLDAADGNKNTVFALKVYILQGQQRGKQLSGMIYLSHLGGRNKGVWERVVQKGFTKQVNFELNLRSGNTSAMREKRGSSREMKWCAYSHRGIYSSEVFRGTTNGSSVGLEHRFYGDDVLKNKETKSSGSKQAKNHNHSNIY